MQKVDQQIVQVVLVGLLVGLHVVDGAVLLHLEPRAGPHLSLHQQHQLPPRLRLQVTIKKETNFSYLEVFFLAKFLKIIFLSQLLPTPLQSQPHGEPPEQPLTSGPGQVLKSRSVTSITFLPGATTSTTWLSPTTR